MRSAPAIFTILGLGLGVLFLANRSRTRDPMTQRTQTVQRTQTTLRDRAIEAQKISARTSQIARELAEKWSATMKSNTMEIASC